MMARRLPAAVGDAVGDVDTPAALIDLDVLEANIRRAVDIVTRASAGRRVSIRPHAKAHKCAEIALLQLALSGGLTTGVTVQKVVEAEAMVAAGVMDVLVTNEVVAPTKLARLVALARRGATVGVLVDDVGAARALSDATARGGDGSIGGRATVSVLIEVDVGHHRCGVADPAAAVALGALVSSLPGLVLRGIQAYHGSAQHVRDPAERRAVATRAAAAAAAARDALLAAGLCCDVVTGGGTGTFAADAASGVYTELQPGSYVLGDADYARNGRDAAAEGGRGDADGARQCWLHPFPPSLFLLSQVMSVRRGEWVVIDSGLKAQSVDSGPPVVVSALAEYVSSGLPSFDEGAGRFRSNAGALAVASVSDEHSTLKPPGACGAGASPVALPELADLLLLMVGHCDPTVNHFDHLVAVRRGVVEGVWPVTARSPGV